MLKKKIGQRSASAPRVLCVSVCRHYFLRCGGTTGAAEPTGSCAMYMHGCSTACILEAHD